MTEGNPTKGNAPMRTLMAPILWFGRILLWIFLLPVGIWRSLRHHRKKGTRKAVEQMRREMEKNSTR